MVFQLLTMGRFYKGGIKWTILINGSFELAWGLLAHSREWLNMVKISKCCTDAHSWLLGLQLIKWSFSKPIDRYSCRFSIEGASIQAAYSELMRKVLIKLAICSIAFINGKIALFAADTTIVVIPCCCGCHWNSYCFHSLCCTPACSFQACTLFHEIFLACTAERLQCLLMKISFWRSMSVLNATMSSILPLRYRSSNTAKTYSSFQSINLFWSTRRARSQDWLHSPCPFCCDI